MENTISKEKLDKYKELTSQALQKIVFSSPEKTHLANTAIDFYEMAQNYFEDAKHFEEKEDYVNAFAALNYAHGWLDAGARMGLFDVDHDSRLFTVD